MTLETQIEESYLLLEDKLKYTDYERLVLHNQLAIMRELQSIRRIASRVEMGVKRAR